MQHQLTLRASDEDLDELGHVNNAVYVRWLQEVAWAHSLAVGYGRSEYAAVGGSFVVRKHEIEYLQPAFAGDTIVLQTRVAWWKGATCERQTEILRADGTPLARARTLWAFVASRTGRPTRIPRQVVAAFDDGPS